MFCLNAKTNNTVHRGRRNEPRLPDIRYSYGATGRVIGKPARRPVTNDSFSRTADKQTVRDVCGPFKTNGRNIGGRTAGGGQKDRTRGNYSKASRAHKRRQHQAAAERTGRARGRRAPNERARDHTDLSSPRFYLRVTSYGLRRRHRDQPRRVFSRPSPRAPPAPPPNPSVFEVVGALSAAARPAIIYSSL